jgi:hypothetical protein
MKPIAFTDDHTGAILALSEAALGSHTENCYAVAGNISRCYPGNPDGFVPLSRAEILDALRVLWELGYDYGLRAAKGES